MFCQFYASAKIAIYLSKEGDRVGSFPFLKRSAEEGYTSAEYICVLSVTGTAKASKWTSTSFFARAAAKGHEPSIDALAHLDRKVKEAESERVAADLLRDA